MRSSNRQPASTSKRKRIFVPRDPIGAAKYFWARVDVSAGLEACWHWTAYTKPDGYGMTSVRRDGRSVRAQAHRVAYEFAFGTIQPGMCVMHSCDNPPCCNPAHLSAGTMTENNRDMDTKGRRATPPLGEYHKNAKLTTADVLHMRSAFWNEGVSREELVACFGAKQVTVSGILARGSWKHVDDGMESQ